MRAQKHHNENEYLSLLQSDPINEIKSEINDTKKVVIELGMLLNKSDRDIIRKRLKKISEETPNRTQKEDYLKN